VTSSGFSLVKWYLDCVTDSGDVAILYSARLKWHGPSLAHSSLIGVVGESRTERSSLRSAKIGLDAEMISVDAPQLGLHGVWIAQSAPFERTVFENQQGSVVWNCLQPRDRGRQYLGRPRLRRMPDADSASLETAHAAFALGPICLPARCARVDRLAGPLFDETCAAQRRGGREPLNL